MRRPIGHRGGEKNGYLSWGGAERKSDMPKITELGYSSATEHREFARRWRAERCWELSVKI